MVTHMDPDYLVTRKKQIARLLLEASRYLSGELVAANTSIQARDIASAVFEHEMRTRNGISLYAIVKEFHKRQERKLS